MVMTNKEPKDNIGVGPGRGRPKGVRNKCGAEFRAIIAEAGPDVAKRIVEIARDEGHSDQLVACRFIGDRLDPPPRGTLVRFDLPRIQSAADVPIVIDALLQACAGGNLTTTEAGDLANVIARLQSAVTLVELDQRIRQIETGTAPPPRLAAVR
jgi:hypothetical protein